MRRCAFGFVHGRQTGRGHQPGHECDTGVALLARGVVRHDLGERGECLLRHAAIELAVAAEKRTPGRVRGLRGNAGQSEGPAVEPVQMPAAVLDRDGMVGRRFVEILAAETPLLDDLGIVVLESLHPLTRWRGQGARVNRRLDRCDARQIAIDGGDFLGSAPGRMRCARR